MKMNIIPVRIIDTNNTAYLRQIYLFRKKMSAPKFYKHPVYKNVN